MSPVIITSTSLLDHSVLHKVQGSEAGTTGLEKSAK